MKGIPLVEIGSYEDVNTQTPKYHRVEIVCNVLCMLWNEVFIEVQLFLRYLDKIQPVSSACLSVVSGWVHLGKWSGGAHSSTSIYTSCACFCFFPVVQLHEIIQTSGFHLQVSLCSYLCRVLYFRVCVVSAFSSHTLGLLIMDCFVLLYSAIYESIHILFIHILFANPTPPLFSLRYY